MKQIEVDKKLWDFLTGEADQKTSAEVEAWLGEAAENQRYFKDFQESYIRMRWSLRRKMIRHDHFSEVQNKIHRRIFLRRLQIAASVMVLLGVGGMTWTLWPEPKDETMKVVQAEVIKPGKSQAVLILSEGTEIPISAVNTELEERDGTHIKVDEQGEVRYAVRENAPKAEKMVYNKLVIPRGGEFTMVLADGTKVWLNAATELKYPTNFIGKERVVYLKGEAYFDVKHDPVHPFIVRVDQQVDIKVFGTEFNVNSYLSGKVETVLVNGSVEVRSKESGVKIRPGDKADYTEGNPGISVKAVDVTPYVAWKDGNFIFQNEPLEQIMEKLALWYDVDVFFARNELRKVCLSGDMKRYDEICDLLYYFEKSSGVKFKIQDRTIIIDE